MRDLYISLIISLIILLICFAYVAAIILNRIKKMKLYNAGDVVRLIHVSGLPISEWINCLCYIGKVKYTIEADGNVYVLDRKRIKKKYLTTNIEIQKQAVSNTKGALVGGQLFGVVGTMLASNSKIIDVKTVKRLLVFEYEDNDGEMCAYVFNIAGKLTDNKARYVFNIKNEPNTFEL